MLRWMTDETKDELNVQLKIRTYRKPAILLFVELKSQQGQGSALEYGSIEVIAQVLKFLSILILLFK